MRGTPPRQWAAPVPPGEGSSAATGPETCNDKKWSNIQREEGDRGGAGWGRQDGGRRGSAWAVAQKKRTDACRSLPEVVMAPETMENNKI